MRNKPNRDTEDVCVWRDEEGDVYAVKNKKLKNNQRWDNYELFFTFWRVEARSTTQHFARRVILNRVTTKENLKRRGINEVNLKCAMCRK